MQIVIKVNVHCNRDYQLRGFGLWQKHLLLPWSSVAGWIPQSKKTRKMRTETAAVSSRPTPSLTLRQCLPPSSPRDPWSQSHLASRKEIRASQCRKHLLRNLFAKNRFKKIVFTGLVMYKDIYISLTSYGAHFNCWIYNTVTPKLVHYSEVIVSFIWCPTVLVSTHRNSVFCVSAVWYRASLIKECFVKLGVKHYLMNYSCPV